jgi:hypothetical protein
MLTAPSIERATALWIYFGARIEIDDELQACLNREQSAWQETLNSRSATREVLDRKRAEISLSNPNEITSAEIVPARAAQHPRRGCGRSAFR